MNSNYIGAAGEHRVLSELLLRGYKPALLCVDNGIDIILENNITIQVKTISKQHTKYGYTIGLTNAYYKHGKRARGNNNIKTTFVIVWLIDIDTYYIIPSEIIGKITTLNLSGTKSKYNQYKNNWKLIEKGGEVKHG